jgi:hypothetical protein
MKLDELVTEDKVSAVLSFLAGNDEAYADLKVATQRTEYLAKLEEAMVYKTITVGSIEDKRAEAKISPKVMARWDAHYDAVLAYEKLRAKRERAVLIVDLWRSLNANRRVGNV